jgi:hypothetical protein
LHHCSVIRLLFFLFFNVDFFESAIESPEISLDLPLHILIDIEASSAPMNTSHHKWFPATAPQIWQPAAQRWQP